MSEKSYDFPENCRYTDSDEWVRLEDGLALMGITDYAQSELSDVVYVEQPEVGAQLEAGQNFGVVESVKAVGDLVAPLAGEVVRINTELEDSPELVNEEPYGRGWLIALQPEDEEAVESLMTAEEYLRHVEARSGA
ncbi:MAG: glycine cleavage system protein GcvH [Proteobacteria bacterium]|nr:glycine cleavage system protein GcvH [Pseudomonadota bacterium]